MRVSVCLVRHKRTVQQFGLRRLAREQPFAVDDPVGQIAAQPEVGEVSDQSLRRPWIAAYPSTVRFVQNTAIVTG